MTASSVSATGLSGRSGPAWNWARYLVGRAAGIATVLVSTVVLTFLIIRLVPGDPVRAMLGMTATSGQVEQVRHQMGLTDPLPQQFVTYVSHLAHGDLGRSFRTRQPVTAMLGQRLPVTAQLALAAVILVLVVGFSVGVLTAVLSWRGRARWVTNAFTAVASVFGALPEYISGTLLVLIFALNLHLLPVQGGSGFPGLVLPAISVALAPAAMFARLVRGEMESALAQDYVMTAMSKRISLLRLTLRHTLPNVVTSTLTLGGLLLIALLGGTVVTENVFDVPGLGTEVVQAIQANDYPVVQGILLVLGFIAAAMNLLVDIVLGLLDPRTLGSRSAP